MTRGLGWIPQVPDHRDHEYLPTVARQTLAKSASIDFSAIPVLDQGQLGSCFPAGTLIRMADGSERAIEDVRLGEYVVTAEGRTGMVRQTMLRLEEEGLVKLSLWGYGALRLTAEHPVLTDRGYVAAGELRQADYVALPRYQAPANETIRTEALISRKEMRVRAGVRRVNSVLGRGDVALTYSTVPETIGLTPRFGRLVGLFLAEGSTDSGKARWTFGAHEEETLVAECVDLMTDLGIVAHVQHRPNNSINVVCYGTAWARLWERLCGTGAGEKALHPLLSGGPSFDEAILRGWLAGDGYLAHKRGNAQRHVGTTVSKRLALAMYDIAQTLGLRPVLRRDKAKVNGAAKKRRDFYSVEIAAQSDNYRCKLTETHAWRRARAVATEEFAGHVYNLSVEGDESYVAEGVGVHNCTAHGSSAAVMYDQHRQGQAVTCPSRLFVYWNTRNLEGSTSQDAGGQVRDAIKTLATVGAPPEADWPYSDQNPGPFTRHPPARAYLDATRQEALVYQAVAPGHVRQALQGGDPVVFGFSVYESFQSSEVATTGVVPMPGPGDAPIGGHCVIATGFNRDDPTSDIPAGHVRCRNSWSSGWGASGDFFLPYGYFTTGLATDLWVVKTIGAH